MFFLLIFICI